jgi:hypothetical protein
VPQRGGNDPHNDCAKLIPQNSFPGWDVLVNGKQFDALVLVTRTLWDIKTDNFDKHSRRSQQFFIEVKLPELQREKRLAEECGRRPQRSAQGRAKARGSHPRSRRHGLVLK